MDQTTKHKKLNSRSKGKIGKTLVVCLFWLAFWQVLAVSVGNELLLPEVLDTAEALLILVQDIDFYMDVLWTMFRCILSILLSFGLGFALAYMAKNNDYLRSLMTLPVSFFKAVPVMAIVIYVILLVNSNWVAVVACFLMCFPIVYTNVLTGLDSVSAELMELAKIYEFKEREIRKYIIIPSIIPSVISALKIIAGLSWKAVVAAEVLSVPQFSLGQGMISAKYYLETPTLFAYIIVIVSLSLCLEKLILTLTDKISSKRYVGSKITFTKFKNPSENDAVNFVADNTPGIKIDKVTKCFDDKRVLEGVTFEVSPRARLAINGPSGSGKTTLARIIAGLEKNDVGQVTFDKWTKIAYLFQEDRLLPWLNVYDNLAMGLIHSKNVSLNGDAIVEMAQKLELEDVLWSLPEELSGGMKHRVALGRTLLADSNLLILDEPFRGLDEELKERIVDRLWEDSTAEKTVIVITHSQSDAELLGIDTSLFI